MPWHIIRRGVQHCVALEGETTPIDGGCHETRGEAEQHMAALYANEPGASRAALIDAQATLVATVLDPPVRYPPAEGARILRPSTCSCGTGACAGCSGHEAPAPAARSAAAVRPLSEPFPAPEYPAAQMFDRPAWLERGQGLTIMDDGTVAGYFHDGVGCIIGAPGHPASCTPPTPSPTGYAAFHQNGPITLEDGSQIRVGVIGNVGGHANPYASASTASRHYADPRCQMILCRAHDDIDERGQWHGAYIAGVLVPGLTYGDVAEVQRSALSGDWRPMDDLWWERNGVSRQAAASVGFFDCLGPTLVNRPGLPLVRAYRQGARAASVLGGLGGIQLDEVSNQATVGGPMQSLTLADGTVLELPDGSSFTHEDGRVTVQLPAPAATADATEPVAEPVAAAAAEAPEPIDPARFAAVEQILHEQVVPFMSTIEAERTAAIEARRASLEDAPALPAAVTAAPVPPHEFKDENEDGKCDICGLPKEMHKALAPAAG